MSDAFSFNRLGRFDIRPSIVALIALAVALPMARHVGPMPVSLDRVIAADNLTTYVVYMVAAVTQMWRLKYGIDWEWGDRRLVVFGWCLILLAWAHHRLYWVPWRWWHELGYRDLHYWWKDDMAWMTTPSQAVAWAGAVLVMSPLLRVRWPRSWHWVGAGMVVAVWFAAYQVPDIVQIFFGCGEAKPTWVAAEGRCR